MEVKDIVSGESPGPLEPSKHKSDQKPAVGSDVHPEGIEAGSLEIFVYHDHGSIIHNSLKLEMTQMSIRR